MALVTLQDIHVSFGSEVVFDELNLQLHPGDKVGMVGPNGSGKSTVLKLIIDLVKPDIGKVIKQKALRVGYLPQEARFSGSRTVLEEMHAGVEHIFKLQDEIHTISDEMESLSGSALEAAMRRYDRLCHDFEIAGGYEYESRISATLAGLGFESDLHHVRTSALSGGQLSRLGLAQVLMLETDLLLLDEPTNHLDLQATEWLERFLTAYRGACVIVSHDRYLLDKVAGKIVEVENRGAGVWQGNYGNYIRTRQTLRLQQQREYEKRVEMVERTRDFIARNKDQEGMRKTARGRKTRLERLLREQPDFLDKPIDDKTVSFSFARTDRTSDLVLRCEGLAKSFDSLTLFEDLTFDVLNGDRLGITGPNGTGKSTLLALAMGRLEPSAGGVRMGANLRIGYIDQHGDTLDPARTVLDEACSANPTLSSEKIRNRLGAFLFTGDDVFKKCGDLSGGQRNRLMLCKLVLGEPEVLVMDEPTNHLDIDSREMLESALEDFTGTIIAVSHDRYFLDRIVDRLLVIGCGETGNRRMGVTEFFEGEPAYSCYASVIEQRRQTLQQQAQAASGRRSRRPSSRERAGLPKTPEELKPFNKYSPEQIEQMITDLEGRLAEMKERFGDPSIYKDPTQLTQLQSDYDAKTAELDLLYRAYEHRSA